MPNVDPRIPGIHHLGLVVRDLERSRRFFDAVMPRMDWQVSDDNGEPTYTCGNTQIYLQQNRDAGAVFQRYGVGLQHLAFNAPSRERVDALHGFLLDSGILHDEARLLDAPAPYPEYSPGYYAVFFTDPSGIVLEYCYTPDLAL